MPTIQELEQKIAKLEQRIKELEDPFLHAPKKAKWFAVNEDGYGYFYTHKPRVKIDSSIFDAGGHTYFEAGYFPKLAKDWRNSLRRRKR